jgi:hypothetical protein
VGGCLIDIHSTTAGSTGYQLDSGASIMLTALAGVASFAATASSAAGAPELSFLAAR